MAKLNRRHSFRKRPDNSSEGLHLSAGRAVLAVMAGLGLYILLSRIPSFINAVSSTLAWTTGLFLSAFGTDASVSGPIIEVSRLGFLIGVDCTPLAPILLLSAAMMAFPAGLRAKLTGIALGAIILSAINLVRVVSLIYVGLYLPEWLEMAHLLIWQALMILAAVLIWLLWLRRQLLESRA